MSTVLAMLIACGDGPPSGVREKPPSAAQLRAITSGSASQAVDPNRRFVLATPQATSGDRELSAGTAVTYATGWIRRYAPITRGSLEKTHGAPLNFAHLNACGRPLYARSSLASPPAEMPDPFRRPYGPWWLVTFCDDGAPAVSVAISAWATDLFIKDGQLHFPAISGNEVVAIGIPLGQVGEYPASPEIAAEMVARQTGRRIAAVPELIMPIVTQGIPQYARWRVTLDRSAVLRAEGRDTTVSDVYVAPAGGRAVGLLMYAASKDQPTAVNTEWWPLPTIGERGVAYEARKRASVTSVSIARRVDSPVRLSPIAAGGQ